MSGETSPDIPQTEMDIEQVKELVNESGKIGDIVAEAIHKASWELADQASKTTAYATAFLTVGRLFAPGGDCGLNAVEFRTVLTEFLTKVGKSEAYMGRFQELLDKKKSGTLQDAEEVEFEAFWQVNESLNSALLSLSESPDI